MSVELAVSDYQGSFHAAYFADSNEIWYTSTPVATPDGWNSPATVVNETNYASKNYPRPTVTVNPTASPETEAAIAWTDYRNTYYDIYFDSDGFACGDANMSGGTDIVDALWIARSTVGLDPQPFDEVAADVHVPPLGVDIVDALMIARFTVGLPTPGTCLMSP